MTTSTFNTTTEKLSAMLMTWDEDHDTNLETEARNLSEDKTTRWARFDHDNSEDMQQFLEFMNTQFPQ